MQTNCSIKKSGKKKLFCRVCFKAGKSFKQYTSHYTKDFTSNDLGAIVCPTVLTAQCGYCKEFGHWKKYCNKLSEKNKRREKKETYKNTAELELLKEDFPILSNSALKRHSAIVHSYINNNDSITPILDNDISTKYAVSEQHDGPLHMPKIKRIINWCDTDDSDED